MCRRPDLDVPCGLEQPSLSTLVKQTVFLSTFLSHTFFAAVLEAGGRSDLSEGTLVELWLQKGDSYKGSVQIPLDRASVEAETEFELCNCVPGMGTCEKYSKMHFC